MDNYTTDPTADKMFRHEMAYGLSPTGLKRTTKTDILQSEPAKIAPCAFIIDSDNYGKTVIAFKGGERKGISRDGGTLYKDVQVSANFMNSEGFIPDLERSNLEAVVTIGKGMTHQSSRTVFVLPYSRSTLPPHEEPNAYLAEFRCPADEARGLKKLSVSGYCIPVHGIEGHIDSDGSATLDAFAIEWVLREGATTKGYSVITTDRAVPGGSSSH